MDMTTPNVSVVIPTLNRLGMLKRVLAALEEQSMQPKEVIVADGGSTDGTAEFVCSLGRNTTYLRQDAKFMSNARNCAILRSTADIIAFLDDDAIPLESWLSEIAKSYKMNQMIGGIGGRVISSGSSLRMSDRLLRSILGPAHIDYNPRWLCDLTFEVDRLPGCNMSFRRSVLDQVAYRVDKRLWFFDEFYDKTNEDLDLCLRVRKSGYKLLLNTRATVLHLTHSEHISTAVPGYTSFKTLLSQHDNAVYLYLKCFYYGWERMSLTRVFISNAYLSSVYLLRSIRYRSLRKWHLDDSQAAILALRSGYLKFLKHRSLAGTP